MIDQLKDTGAAYLDDEKLLTSNHSREVLNQVPKGFKQTELGIIPEDWDVVKLGTIATVHDGTHQTPHYVHFGVPFYSVEHVTRRDFSNTKYISLDEHRFLTRSFKIERGDVLMTRIGSVGECVHVDWNVEASFYVSLALLKIHGAEAPYIAAYSESSSFKNEVELHSLPSATPKKINLGPISDIRLVLPRNSSEQNAIANALSDVDALIDSLEALIAKKQAIKTATMQQLLTGRTRLPQFARRPDGTLKGTKHTELGEIPEDWEVYSLGSISSMHGRIGWQGLKQEEFSFNDQQPFLITGMNFKDGKIRWDEVYHIAEDRYEMDKNIQLKSGDILMTKDGTIGKLLFVDSIPQPGKATLNSHLLVFRPKFNQYVPKFLYFLMNTRIFDDHIELNKSGSTFFGITQQAMEKFKVLLPPIQEQEEVATMLSDMDDEIEELHIRLDKTRQLKQGMMQKLLTGHTRLVKPEAIAP